MKMIEGIIGGCIGFAVAVYLLNVWHEHKLYKQAKEEFKCHHCNGTGWSQDD